jgi:hypothetical protein
VAARGRDRASVKDEWQSDCIADMVARGYAICGKTASNTMLILGSLELRGNIDAGCIGMH